MIDEVDRRELWAKLAYSSMFELCVKRFHMSEAVAARRIGAARAARCFPLIFEMVGRGEIHLGGVHRLRAHLTEDNHVEVLRRARHKTIREIEVLVKELAPLPDVPSRLRALPLRDAELSFGERSPDAAVHGQTQAPPTSQPPAARRGPDPKPLSPRRYELEVTIGEEARGQLRELQDLLAHRIPDGDPAAIVERALTVLLERTVKERTAASERPRGGRRDADGGDPTRTRYIPAHVRREVWKRDGGRCTFVSEDGRRCEETRGLELGHHKPWAKAGGNTTDDLALECRAHNRYAAHVEYGRDFVEEKVRERRDGSVREVVAIYA